MGSASQQNDAATPTKSHTTRANAASIFGSGLSPVAVPPASTNLKRKANDPELQVIDIDATPDLTLIVGTPSHPMGQKAFRVCKGSFRNASIVWTKMMRSNLAESKQIEISFPDDSCQAFLIVLRIAHFQVDKIPDKLSREELVDLALLADKYQLETVVRLGMDFKQWLKPHHAPNTPWPANTWTHLQEFALITATLNFQADFEFLVNTLAMTVEVDESGAYHYNDEKQSKVLLRADLPLRIFRKS
ncbi:hypothetical protein EK21DRAFT_52800 [Setomelanomma holmii]|uniref:BTB domain-containing protein n=1 Tax=Setomelanomma holmii TaxID=210430 RepID=A0A9P4HIW8_9PLEO|nr:hypothetical protein EK21DRAFT_52800 [Setomelanomma holmii]